MNTKLAAVIRAVIILLIASFAAICAIFFPNFIKYADSFIGQSEHLNTVHTAICIYGAAVTLPCAVILCMAFGFASAVRDDRIFTKETASLLSRISAVLFTDCAVFLPAVIALAAVGEYTVSPLLALIDLIGFALAVLLGILADYIRRAAVLKEEADATL